MGRISKSLALILILIMAISSLSLFFEAIPLGRAQSGTNESGLINSDTTWTKANSPYNLKGNVLVNNGVTLTIQSGTIVNLGSYYIEVNGTIQAIGNNANPITFNDGQISFTQYSDGWNEVSGSGSIISYAVLSSSVSIIGSSPMISYSNISCAGVIIGISGGSPIISNNKITSFQNSDQYGRPQQSYAGIQLSENTNAIVTGNVISGAYDRACVVINDGSPIIQRNLIQYGNGLYLGTMSALASPIIQNNTFSFCNEAIVSASGSLGLSSSLVYNNFANSSQFNIYWVRTIDLNATFNWWGTAKQTAIANSIYDNKNDFNLGSITFVPFLTAPNPQAPTTPTATPTPTPSPSPTPIPEFPTWIVPLLLIIMVTIAGLSVYNKSKRSLIKKHRTNPVKTLIGLEENCVDS